MRAELEAASAAATREAVDASKQEAAAERKEALEAMREKQLAAAAAAEAEHAAAMAQMESENASAMNGAFAAMAAIDDVLSDTARGSAYDVAEELRKVAQEEADHAIGRAREEFESQLERQQQSAEGDKELMRAELEAASASAAREAVNASKQEAAAERKEAVEAMREKQKVKALGEIQGLFDLVSPAAEDAAFDMAEELRNVAQEEADHAIGLAREEFESQLEQQQHSAQGEKEVMRAELEASAAAATREAVNASKQEAAIERKEAVETMREKQKAKALGEIQGLFDLVSPATEDAAFDAADAIHQAAQEDAALTIRDANKLADANLERMHMSSEAEKKMMQSEFDAAHSAAARSHELHMMQEMHALFTLVSPAAEDAAFDAADAIHKAAQDEAASAIKDARKTADGHLERLHLSAEAEKKMMQSEFDAAMSAAARSHEANMMQEMHAIFSLVSPAAEDAAFQTANAVHKVAQEDAARAIKDANKRADASINQAVSAANMVAFEAMTAIHTIVSQGLLFEADEAGSTGS